MSATRLHEQFATARVQRMAVQLGMWIFLATEIMFFGPLFAAYLQGRLRHPEAFAAASRHTDILSGTINTLILLTSSLLVALAVHAVQRRDPARGRRRLWAAALLGTAFLAVKAHEYLDEWRHGLVPGAGFSFDATHSQGAQMFYWLYFAMTGLHALHLLVGITLLVIFAIRLRGPRADTLGNPVEVTGLYWHFVDAVWVFLFPLLYLVGRHG